MPAASWPSTMGRGGVQSPFMMCQSLWQMPAALTLTRASPACGPCWMRSTTWSGVLASKSTAAFTGVSFVRAPGGARVKVWESGSGDGADLDLHGGRHGDRTVQRSALAPGGDEVLGLRLVHAAQLEGHVDGLKARLRRVAHALDHHLHAP